MTHPCAIPGVVAIDEHSVRITNVHAQAEIALLGATVSSFIPAGGSDVLWVSPLSAHAQGKPMRGGVPICWPWFGPHPNDSAQPGHGVARVQRWSVVSSAIRHDGSTVVELDLPDTPAVRAALAASIHLRLRVIVGSSLHMELITSNLSMHAITISEALHTYLAVSSARSARISGLAGAPYRDKIAAMAMRVQDGDVTFSGPTDRVYQPAGDSVLLSDGARRVRVTKRHAGACVVWNPWEPAEQKIPDLGAHWPGFVCIEAVNVFESAVTILPQTQHTLTQIIAVEHG